MIALAGAFTAGILTLQLLPQLPGSGWLIVAALIALACAFLCRWRLMLYVIGVLWACLIATQRIEEILPSRLQGQDLVVTGKIGGLPQYNDIGARFDFIVERENTEVKLPSKLRLSWYHSEIMLKAGQRWRLTVRLKQPHGMMNPGGFDYERWLFINGIGATGYVRNKPVAVLLDASGSRFEVQSWRQYLADRLQTILTGSERLGIIQALIIGERHGISPRQWEVLRKTGTVHLIAISGLHIGLVAGLVFLIVRKFAAFAGVIRVAPQNMAAVTALSAALLYAALAGFSIPTVRALLMLTIAMAAIMLQRNTSPFNVFALALMAVLLLDPLAVLSPGFWLSFAAVAVIIYQLSARRATTGYWSSLLKINWATSIGLAPLLWFTFQQVSLIAPLANVIAVPIVSLLIVPLALFSTLLMEFAPTIVAEKSFQGLDVSLEMLLAALTYLSELPYAAVTVREPETLSILLALAGTLLLLSPVGLPCRRLGLVLIVPLVTLKPEIIEPGAVRFTLLDVGQGLAAVVQTNAHLLIYDTGAGLSENYDMGRNVVLPYLRTKGLERIDMMMISHGDNDHIGGAAAILDNIAVDSIVTSVPDVFKRVQAIPCVAGHHWAWDQVYFRILSPPKAGFVTENDNSCVLKISSRYGSLLLTGDIEQSAERWLQQHYAKDLQANILIAPHHGSKSSSSKSFIESAEPQAILVPAGYRNKFAHPSAEVTARYRQLGIAYFNSADEGALQVRLNAAGITLDRYRNKVGRYWNWPYEQN